MPCYFHHITNYLYHYQITIIMHDIIMTHTSKETRPYCELTLSLLQNYLSPEKLNFCHRNDFVH